MSKHEAYKAPPDVFAPGTLHDFRSYLLSSVSIAGINVMLTAIEAEQKAAEEKAEAEAKARKKAAEIREDPETA